MVMETWDMCVEKARKNNAKSKVHVRFGRFTAKSNRNIVITKIGVNTSVMTWPQTNGRPDSNAVLPMIAVRAHGLRKPIVRSANPVT